MEQHLQTVYQHHDLLIEMGKVEMAMERLQERPANDRNVLQPVLETRLIRLREELGRLKN